MITQELIAFIKAQLQEGKSREQIAGMLMPHGWALEDINSGFAQVMPTMPATPITPTAPAMSPIVQEPEMVIAQPQIIQPQIVATQPVIQTQAAPMGAMPTGSGLVYWFKNPNLAFTGIVMVISLIVSSLAFYFAIIGKIAPLLSGVVSYNTLIIGLVVAMVVSMLLGGVIIQFVTKVLGFSNRSFGRAFIFASTSLAVAALLSLISLAGASPIVASLPGVIVWGVWFAWYYEVGIGKTLLAFVLHWLVVSVIGILAFFAATALGLGFASILIKHNANPVLPTDLALQQLQMAQPAMQESLQADQVPSFEGIPMIPVGGASGTVEGATPSANPDYSHVRDVFPVGFPLPADNEVIAAEVLSATNFEGVRYILDYTSTHSLAYMIHAIKTSLEKDGYTVSVNESSQEYRVVTASKISNKSAKTFRIALEKTPIAATVRIVFTQ